MAKSTSVSNGICARPTAVNGTITSTTTVTSTTADASTIPATDADVTASRVCSDTTVWQTQATFSQPMVPYVQQQQPQPMLAPPPQQQFLKLNN